MKRFLYEHAAKCPVSFHMPGHKGGAFYKKHGYAQFLENFMDMDVTEIPGADNLFDADGIIEDVQRRYAALYDAEKSWLTVGGTSASIIASILAVIPRGGRLIMARNCHKSVFNGLALAGGQPVYAYPRIVEGYGISGEVTLEEIGRCIKAAPDAAAVIITSPNYYGICSDIKRIADVVHKAGMLLIVDQAHGAHLKFFHKFGFGKGMPPAAEEQGADIVCNSIHKTLASMTQSAVLNLCSDRADPEAISDKLQMIESSSPSYVLMASLDINASLIEEQGAKLFGNWKKDLEWFYTNAGHIKGLKLMGCFGKTEEWQDQFDLTKLNIDIGIPGSDLEKMLNEKGIFPELYAGSLLMCLTGIGNVRSDYEILLDELERIAAQRGISDVKEKKMKMIRAAEMKGVPFDKEKTELGEAVGRICAASVVPYPPGVPIVCPGEEITKEMIVYIKRLLDNGHKIIGVDPKGRIFTGKQRED